MKKERLVRKDSEEESDAEQMAEKREKSKNRK